MKNRIIVKTLNRSLRNKVIFERAGLSARAWLSASRAHTLAIFPDALQAATFLQDYKTLHTQLNVFMLNELPLTSNNDSVRALLLERGETMRRWDSENGILIATPGALMSSCMLGSSEITIRKDEKFDADKIREWLEFSGYKRSNLVWAPGQYVQRGFIVDVFDPGYSMPIRIEFFDDEIERIGAYHPDTQKSSSELMANDEITLHGMNEAVMKMPFELIPADTMIIMNEPEKIEAQANSFSWLWHEVYDEIKAFSEINVWESVFHHLATFPIVRVTSDPSKADTEVMTDSLPAFKGSPESILQICSDLEGNGFKIQVFTNNPVFKKLPYEHHDGVLSAGFIDRNSKLAFVSDRELSGINANVSLTQWRAPDEWNDAEKLSPGQLVIHDDYGTGIFRGIETIDASGVPMDVLVIEFADDQRLLIPVLQSHKITGLNVH
ncbi:MAG: hypothetical protein IJU31_05650 [Synergistaceae bacterium]|nr:hypothetical protein [Synergistaceae bacterium]